MTNKISVILVDDEKNSRDVLRSLLEYFFPEIDIIGEAENVETAFNLIELKKPQLIFLDIQMPRQSGFALLKKYTEIPFEVIFVTSYEQYAIQAIKFSALDYLLKPIEVSELKHTIKRVSQIIESKQKSSIQIINLLHSLDTDLKERKIAVHVGDHVKLLSEHSIMYLEADERYCNITTQVHERYTTAKYLKEFEDYFGEVSHFIRIHKSYIVNVKFIKAYSKNEPFTIEMEDGKVFEISRRKKQEVLEKVKSLNRVN